MTAGQTIHKRLDKMPMPQDIISSLLHEYYPKYPPTHYNQKRQYVEASYQLHDDIAAQQGAAYCSNHSAFQ